MTLPGKLIFVDLETTGANHQLDRITEIGIVELEGDTVTRWSTLVNPGVSIPPFIQNLTGISNAMVAAAPSFASLAEALLPRLSGGLFIAHNARFDYGFLRSAFKEAGLAWRADTLCTVKLSRLLFPEQAKHNLDALVERHALQTEARHRALADADLLRQFWQSLQRERTPEILEAAVTQLLARPNLPTFLDPELLDDMPNGPGVYLFFGEHDALLYVGKSVHLRQRVLSHFSADLRDQKEMRITQQIRRLEWVSTAGELGALLLEARLIKERAPIHNRRLRRLRELCGWQLGAVAAAPASAAAPAAPLLTYASQQDFGQAEQLYGLFASRMKAEEALRSLAQTHELCLVMLGLEARTVAGKPCFAHQLRRCRGACVGKEAAQEHQRRLQEALAGLKVNTWPYPGAIGLLEKGADGREDLHVIFNWCWLGTAHSEDDARALLRGVQARPPFDHDSYKILLRHVTRGLLEIKLLEA